jgi:membrane dipeptidase
MSEADAIQLLRRALVIEGHRDCYEQIHRLNSGDEDPVNDLVVPRLRLGHVDLVVYSVGGDSLAHSNGRDMRLLATLENISQLKRAISNSDGEIHLVLDTDDLAHHPNDAVGFVMHLEGGGPLEGSLAALEALFDLGVRSMQPAWNLRNALGDGVRESGTEGGLTRFGVEVLQTMERWGMLIDLAHIAPAGFWHALRITSNTLLVSHANARAVHDHPRNLDDEQLKAIAERGGVVGIHALPVFVDESRPTIDRLIDHVAHIADLIGIEHVAFGGDFVRSDGPRSGREQIPPRIVEELDRFGEIDDMPHLVEGMIARGFGEGDIELVLGTNFNRVLMATLPSSSTGKEEPNDHD